MPSTYSPRDMLERLVAFPTVSRNSNLDLIGFVKDYLRQFGIESALVYDDTGTKADLYATIGPNVAGGVVLSGHTDVVPVDGQDWSSDPFRLAERNGRLYGRGTADMKGFSAINLALVPEMLAAGLKHPIHLALSYDEEVGCLGAPRMIAEMAEKLPPARAVIVGEPTLMKVVTEQKGILQFDCAVRGRSVHSSQCHLGVSAVTVAARLIARLDDMMLENAGRAAPQPVFDPPYTTIHCGIVRGGTAHNIVAQDAAFSCDIRAVTGEDPRAFYQAFAAHVRDEVEPALKARAPEAGVTLPVKAYVPGLGGRGGEAERLARMLTGDNGLNGVAYGTEAGQFEEGGYSVVVCGPGSIDQAHQADEFIAVEEVEKGAAFVRQLIAALR